MTIYDFRNYKAYVRALLKTYPQRGRGQFLRIAKLLNIHTTMVTHIFKGDSNLSVEQALKLSQFFAHSELEIEYFVNLVQHERAANNQSREYFAHHLARLKERALNLSERIKVKTQLDEKDQQQFYSAWYYSGIRLLAATQDFQSIEALSQATKLPRPVVARVVEFLLGTGLLKQEGQSYAVGDTSTYVSRESPFVRSHHLNWRLKAIEQLAHIPEEELVFSNSIALSQKDFLEIREELVKFIERFRKLADPSPAEQVCFLNVDWRRVQF